MELEVGKNCPCSKVSEEAWCVIFLKVANSLKFKAFESLFVCPYFVPDGGAVAVFCRETVCSQCLPNSFHFFLKMQDEYEWKTTIAILNHCCHYLFSSYFTSDDHHLFVLLCWELPSHLTCEC